jgi:hypothetical protein
MGGHTGPPDSPGYVVILAATPPEGRWIERERSPVDWPFTRSLAVERMANLADLECAGQKGPCTVSFYRFTPSAS